MKNWLIGHENVKVKSYGLLLDGAMEAPRLKDFLSDSTARAA